MFMQTLDGTIVITALPAMARSLHADPLRMHAVISAYLLAMALLIPASGWLAERYGARHIYLGALAAFTGGSLLCAAADSVPLLVAARVVQGMGGALLLPVGRLAVLRAVPRAQLLQAMSFIAIPALVGPLLGPTLGGWLVETVSWHWIFLINVPIGAACALATLALMPRTPGRRRLPFDFAGYLMLGGAMAALAIAMELLSERRPPVASLLVWAATGAAALACYARHAARSRHPLFSPALLAQRSMSVALGGNLLCRLGSACMPVLAPLLMQLCMGYTPSQAGLMMLPVALAGIAVKRIAAPLIGRAGYRRVLLTNTALLGLTMGSVALLRPGQPWWLHALPLACFGAVNSLQLTAMNTLALKDLTRRQASSGTSLLSMVQMLAMGLGVACAGALLAGAARVFGDATLNAFRGTFVAMGLLTLMSSAVFLRLPRQRPDH
ncbi:MAG: DHA2 family efflux MFS transporter permease subunit [Pseudomonadota bacterium]